MHWIDDRLLRLTRRITALCGWRDNFVPARIMGCWGMLLAGVVAMAINLHDPRIPNSFAYAFGFIALGVQFGIDRDIRRYRRHGAWLALLTRRRRRKVLVAGNLLWLALPFSGNFWGVALAFALLFFLGSGAYYIMSVDPAMSSGQFAGELKILSRFRSAEED